MGLEAKHGNFRGIADTIVITIFWPMAMLSLGLRVWARRIKRVPFVFNDYALFLAAVPTTGTVVITYIMLVDGGMGKHPVDVSPDELIILDKLVLAGEIMWGTANFLIKLSILDLFIQLFWISKVKKASYLLMGLSFCLWAGTVLAALLICRPVAFLWDTSIPGGWCGNQVQVFLGGAISNLALDVIILGVPIPILWTLQMPPTRKLSVSIMFAIGYCICVITGLRIYALSVMDLNDITNALALFSIFSNIEICLGILIACLPTYRPIASRISDSRTTERVVSKCRSLLGRSAFKLSDMGDESSPAAVVSAPKTRKPTYWSRALASTTGETEPRDPGSDQHPLTNFRQLDYLQNNQATAMELGRNNVEVEADPSDSAAMNPSNPIDGQIHVVREFYIK